jgi:hypothetical protein
MLHIHGVSSFADSLPLHTFPSQALTAKGPVKEGRSQTWGTWLRGLLDPDSHCPQGSPPHT